MEQSDLSIQEYMIVNEAEFKMDLDSAASQIKKEAETKLIPNLISEETLPSGAVRAVYRWDLDIDYITSKTDASGVSTMLGTASTHGQSFTNNSPYSSTFSASSILNAVSHQNAHSTTTEKSYIQMTFEDGKMVKREQKGLFEI